MCNNDRSPTKAGKKYIYSLFCAFKFIMTIIIIIFLLRNVKNYCVCTASTLVLPWFQAWSSLKAVCNLQLSLLSRCCSKTQATVTAVTTTTQLCSSHFEILCHFYYMTEYLPLCRSIIMGSKHGGLHVLCPRNELR